jgi:ribosome-associated protein
VSTPDESVKLAVAACDAADDIKADDLTILEVGPMLGIVDLFVLVSTGSDRQLKAVMASIEKKLREKLDRRPLHREGVSDSGWMLLDYGDIVCHVFTREQRGIYALERLWADVPRRDPRTGEKLAPSAPSAPDDSYDSADSADEV